MDKEKNKVKKKKKKTKKTKVKLIVRLIIAIIMLLVIVIGYKTVQNGGGLSGFLAGIMWHNSTTKDNLEEFNVLILGVSTDLDSQLTDTILVASYNPKTQKATLLSIPRDTNTNEVLNEAAASDKINSLYNQTQTADKTLEAVNEITGLAIKNYIVVKTEALVEIVDEIGGVTFDVPIDMYYTSESQGLNINLKKGVQTIDGQEAEWLLRFRHNNDGTTYPAEYGIEDEGRMRTGREFIVETLNQIVTPQNIVKVSKIIDQVKNNIETNMELDTVKDYIPYIVDLDTSDIGMAVLPGENIYLEESNTWIFAHDEEKTKELVEEKFYIRDLTDEEKEEKNILTKSDLKIEVINASGTNSKLQEVVTKLENAGYSVTRTGKSDTETKTKLINKKAIEGYYLENIKETLEIGQISEEYEEYSKVYVKIIIGKDY